MSCTQKEEKEKKNKKMIPRGSQRTCQESQQNRPILTEKNPDVPPCRAVQRVQSKDPATLGRKERQFPKIHQRIQLQMSPASVQLMRSVTSAKVKT